MVKRKATMTNNETTFDWASDLTIVGDGNRNWAVLSASGAWRSEPAAPCVVYSGLQSREATEVARDDALACLNDPAHGAPFESSEVPLNFFNALGRVVRAIREFGIEGDDALKLARHVADAATVIDCEHFGDVLDADERPF
jgi:hypothetical protein